jgi:adenosylhomocysteine nucleosidase
VHVGTLGSGDVWDKETDRILMLNKKYGTLCEDMESIGIYTVSNMFNIPVIGIRIVSNNEILEEEYDRSIGRKSQEFTYEFIKKIILKSYKK